MTLRDGNSERVFGSALASIARAALVVLALAWPAQSVFAQACPAGADIDIDVDDSESWCELCGVGQVTVRVGYADDDNSPITNIVIAEDLSGPGLVPIPNTTTVDVGSGPEPAPPLPTLADGVGNGFTRNLNGRDIDVLQSNTSTVTQ